AEAVKAEKTKIKNAVKSVRNAVTANDAEQAEKALNNAYSVLDASVGKGVYHRNHAQRLKSRLSKSVNGLNTEE
ncbi:MAG: 30S ribosomal protein S20, partial [Erysipelotrichales bacterium]|nr:30S ribosomal protein S20 [Erysipelotrichales bacterium]